MTTELADDPYLSAKDAQIELANVISAVAGRTPKRNWLVHAYLSYQARLHYIRAGAVPNTRASILERAAFMLSMTPFTVALAITIYASLFAIDLEIVGISVSLIYVGICWAYTSVCMSAFKKQWRDEDAKALLGRLGGDLEMALKDDFEWVLPSDQSAPVLIEREARQSRFFLNKVIRDPGLLANGFPSDHNHILKFWTVKDKELPTPAYEFAHNMNEYVYKDASNA